MSKWYGDNTQFFIGKVAIVSSDPATVGRIKVKIFGLHDNPNIRIPEDLPWAQVLVPTTEGGGSGIGNNGIGIQPQSLVFGIFLDGDDRQLPLVLGSIPTKENFVQNRVYAGDRRVRNETGTGLSDKQDDQYSNHGKGNTRESSIGGNYAVELDINLTGSTNLEKAWLWFTSEQGGGYSPEQTAGLLGNFWVESGPPSGGIPDDINPGAENRTREASRGIAQWNPINKGQSRDYVHPNSRLQDLIDFSNDLPLDWLSIEAQLLFVTWELEKMGIAGELRQQNSPEKAARLVEVKYEVPYGYKDPNSESSPRRRQAAREIYQTFTETD